MNIVFNRSFYHLKICSMKKRKKAGKLLPAQVKALYKLLLFTLFFTVWEMVSMLFRYEWCNGCSEKSFLYFCLFHAGNINNAIEIMGITWLLLFTVFFSFKHSNNLAIVSAVITLIFFLLYERNDWRDLPFAFLGIILSFWAIWVPTAKRVNK